MHPYARVEAYFGLLEELRSLLQGNIDLVMVGAVKNPYLARDIERESSRPVPRDQRAYLADVIDSCEAIELAAASRFRLFLRESAYIATNMMPPRTNG